VAVLAIYSDCLGGGGGGWFCRDSSATEDVAKYEASKTDLPSSANRKGRGILYEQLHDRGKVEEPWGQYRRDQLKLWKPVPPVPEVPGRPGEMGKPVVIPASQEALMKEKFKLNQFNLLASDMISLNRSLEDVRYEG